jgi:hypothetical protein
VKQLPPSGKTICDAQCCDAPKSCLFLSSVDRKNTIARLQNNYKHSANSSRVYRHDHNGLQNTIYLN